MTDEEFRSAMTAAKTGDRLLFVADEREFGIAVGLDSGRGVIFLHGGKEVIMAEAREVSAI